MDAEERNIDTLVLKLSDDGKAIGVMAKDEMSPGSDAFPIMGTTIINATGPFTDGMRQMDDPSTPKITAPSSGTHLTLPDYYSPRVRGACNCHRLHIS